jgi:tetratricopeptide (TPR) repeat protein
MTRQERRSRLSDFQKVRRSLHRHDRRRRWSPVSRITAIMLAGVCLFAGYHALAAEKPQAELRQDAIKAQKAGNFKDAYNIYAKLLVDPNDDPTAVSKDLVNAVQCLNRLGRIDETDDLMEKAIATHAKNWRFIETASQQYQNLDHQGFIVAGKYYRGNRRGNDGKWVSAFARDRIRGLQLMQQAMEAATNDPNKADVAEFYLRFAGELTGARFGSGAWRMQYLSDLTKLPDYEESFPEEYYGGNTRGAPVDEEGKPVFHKIPKSWVDAKTDGERWRWCLMQATEYSPAVGDRAKLTFATFLRGQFDVQTMLDTGFRRGFGRGFRPAPPGGDAGIPGRTSRVRTQSTR